MGEGKGGGETLAAGQPGASMWSGCAQQGSGGLQESQARREAVARSCLAGEVEKSCWRGQTNLGCHLFSWEII